MRLSTLAIVLTTLAIALPASAQNLGAGAHGGSHYRWRDAHGQWHFSDSLNDEALKNGYDVINSLGLVIQHVDRQLSPAEFAAAQQAAARQAARQKAAQDQAQADAQMLAAYPTEAAFRTAQQETLGSYDQRIATIRINLRSQEQALSNLLERAAQDEHAKQAVPKSLTEAIAERRNVVAAQNATLAQQQAERAQAVTQNAVALKHYQAIKAAQQRSDGAGTP